MQPIRLEGFRVVKQYPENHTCGFCALSAIYKYYGLNPKGCHLRELLGTDESMPYNLPLRQQINNLLERIGWDTKLNGTYPMDIFAVLYRHGFTTVSKAGRFTSYMSSLRAHLKNGHPALALTRDMAHWVVVKGIDDGGLWILDSTTGYIDPDEQGRHTYRIAHNTVNDSIGGLLLVKRRKQSEFREITLSDFAREYTKGMLFALNCVGRAVPTWIKMLL